MNGTKRFAGYVLLVALAIVTLSVFMPRRYAVPPMKKRVGTHYWQLATGSRIAYFTVATKTAAKHLPILYLHGGPGGYVRDGIIRSLAPLAEDGYNVYFYDQIGSGLSDRLTDITDYTVDRHIRDLAAITDKLGGKVILIGQSWGAILASQFTARYPERTECMVLTSPGPIFPVRAELKKLSPPDSIHLRKPIFTNAQGSQKTWNLRARSMGFFAKAVGWKLASDREADAFATFSNYEVDKSTVCDTANIPPMSAGGGFYAGMRTFESLRQIKDYRPALKKLKTKVLIIKGECDNQPWGYTKEYGDVFQNHQLRIIPAAGHYLWVEQPTLSLTAIRQFLADTAAHDRRPINLR